MAVQTVNVPPTSVNDATFRVWGQALSNAIETAGLVRTTDTGQINWATVTRPNTTNSRAGYEIFRFNDALQATHPVFIRIEYGTPTYSTYYSPQVWMSFGTATDGAGNLAAHASFPLTYMPSSSAVTLFYHLTSYMWYSSTPWPLYVDSDGGGSLMIAGWLNPPGGSHPYAGGTVTVLERTRNMDGTFSDDGVFFLTHRPQDGTQARQMLLKNAPYLAGQPGGGTGGTPGGVNIPTVSYTSWTPSVTYFAGVQYFNPIFTGVTPKLCGPSKHIVTTGQDIPILSTVDLEHYGQTRKWMGTYNGSSGFGWFGLGQVLFRVT